MASSSSAGLLLYATSALAAKPVFDPQEQARQFIVAEPNFGDMSQFDLRYTDEVEPLYANGRCPTLILWGQADQSLPIEGGYRLRDRIPGGRFQAVAGCGHLMQEDAPEAIVGALSRFLLEVVAR